ncbi:MAG: ABC transporter ATP-binding protein [Anaerolineae bacterium]|jgi:branched-chain amino acid transport system ATP-binding protein|nr:ABC transporter ATP-binding protein [Anaerolineae bacterium]MDX9830546.1 ABC transporter ATP-binding protein [Anaerolineae bacterium]
MELEIQRVVKRFGGIQALNGISLRISGNELVGLIGPNGSGKTTLVNTIGGVYQPDSGKILLNGRSIGNLQANDVVRYGVGRTFQVPRAFRRMTVMENMLVPALALYPERGRKVWEKRAREVLDFLTMDHLRNDYARSLSGGQQKLLELGQILMTEPELLMLDEPFAGVHPRLMETIFEYITTVHAQGKAFLIISHDMNSIFTLSQRLVVLSYGDIIADGPPEVVKHDEGVIKAYLGDEAEDA